MEGVPCRAFSCKPSGALAVKMRKESFLNAPEGPQSSLAQLEKGVHLP